MLIIKKRESEKNLCPLKKLTQCCRWNHVTPSLHEAHIDPAAQWSRSHFIMIISHLFGPVLANSAHGCLWSYWLQSAVDYRPGWLVSMLSDFWRFLKKFQTWRATNNLFGASKHRFTQLHILYSYRQTMWAFHKKRACYYYYRMRINLTLMTWGWNNNGNQPKKSPAKKLPKIYKYI